MAEQYHITQFYNIPVDADIDFFDANLVHDSRVFIDPFLIKNSPVEAERALFDRFGKFFKNAYDKSIQINLTRNAQSELKRLLDFHEPKNINMGYTQASNQGHGVSLGNTLLTFYMDVTVREFVRATDAFPQHKYNPVSLQLFTEGIGPDGISDITANLMMDYLMDYTRGQATEWDIPLEREMRVQQDGFNFEEMRWKLGGYYQLPKNPVNHADPLILVPKRWLRGLDEYYDNPTGRVVSILKADGELKIRFAELLEKNVREISLQEIQEVFKSDISIHKRYLESLELDRNVPYNFDLDPLNLLADKKYTGYFEQAELTVEQVDSCEKLNQVTGELVAEFKKHFETMDGWKDAWKNRTETSISPALERSIGRIFRAMGQSFFSRYNTASFIPEAGNGNGNCDFLIVFNGCHIDIELKLLHNSSASGPDNIPAYIHGMQRQLPNYVVNHGAK